MENNLLNDLDIAKLFSLSDDKRIKIYKSSNKNSILDVTSSLNYFEKNTKNELEYKGKIIFNITDLSSNQTKYLTSFMNKSTCKVLMHSIVNGNFKEIFPTGLKDFGRSKNKEKTGYLARILTIQLTERNQFLFKIDQGKGKEDPQTGNIVMDGSPQISVKRFVPMVEAMEMALEILSFIQQQEFIHLLKGNPLFSRYSTVEVKKENTNEDLFFDGKHVTDMNFEELKIILKKLESENTDAAKLTIQKIIKTVENHKKSGKNT